MSQALYRKWRPRVWDEVMAQDPVVQTLRNAVRLGRVSHAYLLAGPRGTGKTTTARLLAKALNCLDEDPDARPCDECEHCKSINEGRFLDMIEIDAASNTSVDDVRALREKVNFAPSQGRWKVYIIDEVHMLSTAAFNALLKTLEEPPAHAIFILATTEIHKIPATVLSRVQRHEFRRISVTAIVDHLRHKAKEEGIEVDEEALTLIARQASGAFRDAISLLDQLASSGRRVTLAEAQEVLGTATGATVIELVEAISQRNAAVGLRSIQTALDSGTDARQLARQMVEYLRGLLLVQMGGAAQVEATTEVRRQMATHAAAFEGHRLLELIRHFNAAAVDTRTSWQPGLGLELALTESIVEPAAVVAQPQTTESPRASATPQAAPQSQPVQTQQSTPTSTVQKPTSKPEEAPARAIAEAAPATPAEPNASPATSATTPIRTINSQEIAANWPRIVGMVKNKNSLAAAALNSVVTRTIRKDVLVLAFASEVVKLKMETVENVALLQSAIQAIVGMPIKVRCVVAGEHASQRDDIDADSMVGTALDLGAKIITEE